MKKWLTKFKTKGQGGVILAIGFVIVFGILFWAFLQIWTPIQDDLLLPAIDANTSASNSNIIKLVFLVLPFCLAVLGVVAVFLIAGQATGRPEARF